MKVFRALAQPPRPPRIHSVGCSIARLADGELPMAETTRQPRTPARPETERTRERPAYAAVFAERRSEVRRLGPEPVRRSGMDRHPAPGPTAQGVLSDPPIPPGGPDVPDRDPDPDVPPPIEEPPNPIPTPPPTPPPPPVHAAITARKRDRPGAAGGRAPRCSAAPRAASGAIASRRPVA